jgi:transposase
VSETSERLLAIALQLGAGPDGFSNSEFARAAGVSSSNAGGWLSTFKGQGKVHRAKLEGQHFRYFDTEQRAIVYEANHQKPLARTDHDPVEVARKAVRLMKAGTVSTSGLSEVLRMAPQVIDAALAPLAASAKLTRISVLRKGVAEFDYRIGVAWVPKDDDFEICRGAVVAPVATVSPVAPPASGERLAGVKDAPPPSTPLERIEAGRRGARSKAVADALDTSFAAPPANLGWAVAPAQQPAPEGEAEPDLQPRIEHAALAPNAPEDAYAEPAGEAATVELIEVDDLVCAMNSHGELALDLGDGRNIKFPPAQAYYLKHFLVNTTVLEHLMSRGQL